MTTLFRSRRIPLFCWAGPWQGTQFCRKMGSTSLAKSTFAGVWADSIPMAANEQSDRHALEPHIVSSKKSSLRKTAR